MPDLNISSLLSESYVEYPGATGSPTFSNTGGYKYYTVAGSGSITF